METNQIKIKSAIIVALLASGAVVGGQAWAARVTGGAAPALTSSHQVRSPGDKAAADDSTSMREGTITGVSQNHDQVEISGSWLKVVDGTTRIFRHGRAVGRGELAKGQAVRFTLAIGTSDRAVLGAVYAP